MSTIGAATDDRYGHNDLNVGQRVELHPAMDRWMMGDGHGAIVGYATPNNGVSVIRERGRKREDGATIYAVKLDKSGKRIRVASRMLQYRGDKI